MGKRTKSIMLSREEVDSLKQFCDENLAAGIVEIMQTDDSGIGYTTRVQVKDLPETLTDITDLNVW